jgi:hypothetical protein
MNGGQSHGVGTWIFELAAAGLLAAGFLGRIAGWW